MGAPDEKFVKGRGLPLNALIIKSYINLLRARHTTHYPRIKVVEFNYTDMKDAFLDEANRKLCGFNDTLKLHGDGRLSFQDPASKVTFVFHGEGYKQKGCPFVKADE